MLVGASAVGVGVCVDSEHPAAVRPTRIKIIKISSLLKGIVHSQMLISLEIIPANRLNGTRKPTATYDFWTIKYTLFFINRVRICLYNE
ncbi:MAG TPA: hypothetical protein DCY42_01090 [Chloroflexi bacterium]|nr:hypothetical protein [Chloroflexota bacterium]